MSHIVQGVAAAPGVGIGRPFVVVATTTSRHAGDPPTSGPIIADVILITSEHYRTLSAAARRDERDEEADVLETYAMLVADPALAADITERATTQDLIAAITAAGTAHADEMAAMKDAYFAARADDIRAITADLVTVARREELAMPDVPPGSVLIARDLSPAETAQIHIENVRAMVVERGGVTSHTAIVARSLGIPAVVGAVGAIAAAEGVSLVLANGDDGVVIMHPGTEEIAAAAAIEARRVEQARASAQLFGQEVRYDGRRVLIAANVGNEAEIAAAVEAKADGIGLYRSEFLFLDSSRAPGVSEQSETYRAAVTAFTDPVIVRTLDIGGDKFVPWMTLPEEDNPYLGVRGLRLCLANPELFATQIDALLVAAADGPLHIMLPMVTSLDDVRRAREVIELRACELGAEVPPVGIMIETPAAALLAPHLARVVDFFSIGTNDLTQYTSAADRGSAALAAYHDPAAPPVLALCDLTIKAAAEATISVGVCGGAAADPVCAALLVGMGADELSVPASQIDAIRMLVDGLDPEKVTPLVSASLLARSAREVRALTADALGSLVA